MTLVLWSGGFDSTLVLYDACVEARKKKLWPVRTLSINHEQVDANREQRRARRRILARMKKRGLAFSGTEVKITSRGIQAFTGDGLIQPSIWLPIATLYLMPKEDLLTGWGRGDDVYHHLSEIQWLFKYHMDLMGKKGNLRLPLEWEPKWMILCRLRKARLVSLPWTCEEPKNWRACGKCTPCLDLKTARYRLKLEGG